MEVSNIFSLFPSSDLQRADSGLYTCQVRTQSGQTSASAYLAVEDEAEEGQKLPPPPDLLAFPASPSKPELVEVGEGSITVQWGKPHRVGASPLRGYQVEHFTSGGVGHWVAAQVQGETFTLTEVLPDAVVVFLVRARNEHGLSPPSLLSDQLSLEGDLGDSKARQKTEMLRQLSTKQVELNEVATIGPRKAKLSWKVIVIAVISSIITLFFLQILGDPDQIRGFHIHIQEVPPSPPSTSPTATADLNTLTISGGGTKAHIVTHLRPNTAYRVFLIPYSLNGLARPSNLRSFTTKEDVPESSPTEVELKLLNSTAAVAYWRRPSQSNLNGELTGFKIEIFSNNSLVTNFTLEPSATSLLLSNLTKSVIYTVRLAAFNRAGMGPFSEPVSLKVEPSLLYQPQLPPHPSLAFPPESPASSVTRLVTETWFVSTIGFLAILLILTLVGCVVFKRRHCKDKSFGHYTGGF